MKNLNNSPNGEAPSSPRQWGGQSQDANLFKQVNNKKRWDMERGKAGEIGERKKGWRHKRVCVRAHVNECVHTYITICQYVCIESEN